MDIAKRALRTKVKANLKNITQSSLIEQSARICRTLMECSQYQTSKTIALYMNMDAGEVKTMEMIGQAFKDEKQVYLPKISRLESTSSKRFGKQKSCLEMLQVETLDQVHILEPQGPYRLLEPAHGNNVLNSQGLDLIIVPGVAFTKDCRRMGHGAGFYDDFIKRYVETTGKHKPYLIGVGLKEQLVETIPCEPHDERLDAVIIDGSLYVKNF